MEVSPSSAPWLLAICGIYLIGCGGTNLNTSTPPATLKISPQPISIPVNNTVTFMSTVSSGINSPNWDLHAYAYGDLGSPDTQAGGSTFVYTAPATPPVYTGAGSTTTPGTVTLEAFDGTAYASTVFTITAPSVTVTLSPATATVSLGGTQQFVGYAIGNVNNALTAEVNSAAGGSASTGTVAPAANNFYGNYTYTAPATMPMTGNSVTVTLVSQADSTKTASAVVTLH